MPFAPASDHAAFTIVVPGPGRSLQFGGAIRFSSSNQFGPSRVPALSDMLAPDGEKYV
jgi:hypothetical protein